jgi:hypothetical protein
LLVAGWTALNRQQVLTHDELDAAAWVAVNTPGQSVFVTDGWLNALTDPAGRLRLLTYTPYIANLGFDADQRVQQVHDIYMRGRRRQIGRHHARAARRLPGRRCSSTAVPVAHRLRVERQLRPNLRQPVRADLPPRPSFSRLPMMAT